MLLDLSCESGPYVATHGGGTVDVPAALYNQVLSTCEAITGEKAVQAVPPADFGGLRFHVKKVIDAKADTVTAKPPKLSLA